MLFLLQTKAVKAKQDTDTAVVEASDQVSKYGRRQGKLLCFLEVSRDATISAGGCVQTVGGGERNNKTGSSGHGVF